MRGLSVVGIWRGIAALYGVETKALNQAVKRNAERFEEGYLFRLNENEVENWKSQIVTSNLSKGEIAGLKFIDFVRTII